MGSLFFSFQMLYKYDKLTIYDWFCGPGSQIIYLKQRTHNIIYAVIILHAV